MKTLNLFMVLLGCTPRNRHTEQHDVFFGIGHTLKDLLPGMYSFWSEAENKIHIDAWRQVSNVDGYRVHVMPRAEVQADVEAPLQLFFLNLGGYRQNEFEEYHYKMLVACVGKGIAIQQARQTAFYRHTRFPGAATHIDDKYGVDVDDIYEIGEILPADAKDNYSIVLTPADYQQEDELHLGYTRLEKL